jgi:predicted nucleic acid-binding protein
MPLVISDASTLIHLAGIGRLALLKEIYEKIVIPAAVWAEVVEQGRGRSGAMEVEVARQAGWIEVLSPTNEPLVHLLKRDLDGGEAEAIALAIERQADLLLLDESDARKVAERYNLPKTGVIGLLIRAKRESRIASLQTELDTLRSRAGFWIAEELYQQVLRVVGEMD